MINYKEKIRSEAKAFNRQVRNRENMGLVPDLQRLKINKKFYNNPWREPNFFNIQWGPIISDIIKEIKKNKKKNYNVLEIGCGTGFLCLEIARAGANIDGIDVSDESIFQATDYLKKGFNSKIRKKINYMAGDALKYKFNKKYDFIIFYRSLHHFKKIDVLFKNLERFQNKNCKLLICEPLRKNFEINNSIFANIFRLALETWIDYKVKLPKKINKAFIIKEQSKIFKEYKYVSKKRGYAQSPMDNSTDDPKKVIKVISKFFRIKHVKYYDAFVDKLIGGLRGKNRFQIARLIKEFDNYLISQKIIKGTTLYLTAQKK